MNLTDLKTNPTAIRVNLQISGMAGAPGAGTPLFVETRVVTATTDTVERESIKFFSGAVAEGTLTVGGPTGTTQPLKVSAGGTPNCYWLPWGEGRVYCGNLANAHDFFCTYTINGCGVIIGGTANTPFVAHANLDSARLNAPVNALMDKRLDFKSAAYKAGMEEVARSQALTYEQFYGGLAATLIEDGTLTGSPITVITPEIYLIRAEAGFGAVFGIKNSSHAWIFYGNWGGKTQKIWP